MKIAIDSYLFSEREERGKSSVPNLLSLKNVLS